jgi:hypothetical protein
MGFEDEVEQSYRRPYRLTDSRSKQTRVSLGSRRFQTRRATLKLRQSTLLTDLYQAAIAFFNSKSNLTSSLCGEDR